MAATEVYDCIVIGGGPGGLLAATYLARFNRSVLLIDNHNSRAELIPVSHNYPGAVKGIPGKKILASLRTQAKTYKVKMKSDCIVTLKKDKKNIFTCKGQSKIYRSKYVILATGLSDIQPVLPNLRHDILTGKIRHCIICDAYEVTDKKIAVLGGDEHAFKEVVCLLRYSKKLSLIPLNNLKISAKNKKFLIENNIPIITDNIIDIFFKRSEVVLHLDTKKKIKFDTLYSALGAEANSELARQLGAKLNKMKQVITNRHQCSSVPGFYAIGDVSEGLAQISTAYGEAANAATDVHNQLLKAKAP